MTCCSVLECKNESKRKNISNGGISYHRFPKEANIKEKWINATGRVNWMPTKFNTICSAHFLNDDFLISNKGHRYIKPTAVPRLKIMHYDPQNITCATSSKQDSNLLSSDLAVSKKRRISTDLEATPKATILKPEIQTQQFCDNSSGGSNYSSPTKNKVISHLRFCHEKIRKQGLKIKRLQTQNRRLKKKINHLDELLLKLEEKFAMTKENLDCLQNIKIEVRSAEMF
ncbi:THAP domain-containing protein 1-like isoform X2 [Colias croceus]|uniref:THAP domain-containing protein 1-like isoform X2 n=1 Tax=Colias crocea TaxID=72248 RepID=UPI001E27BC9A|nr:THAP domain-containing protein 1-like isoform X2 [Colias croceus]